MSWPLTPLVTFVANNPPTADADFLNAIQAIINKLAGFPPIFGDGGDGALVAAAGTTVASVNMDYTNVDLSGTAVLKPSSHIIRASQFIRLRGTSVIQIDGTTTDDSDVGSVGGGLVNSTLGIGSTGGTGGTGGGGAGGAGGAVSQARGGTGGAGGASTAGPGGAGGAGGTCTISGDLDFRALIALLSGFALGFDGSVFGAAQLQGGSGGGGGGGQNGGPNNPGLGGGGGGGPMILCAPVIDIGAGCLVSAKGGRGNTNTGAPGDFGAGGGGGGGGYIVLVCAELIETGTISVAGGSGGVSSGDASGFNGNAGTIVRKILFP